MARRPAPTRLLFTTGVDLPLFSGTAPAANVQTFKPMDEAALPQAELFPRPPVEMRSRTAKRPTTPSPYPTTPALFAEACQWGEYQTEGE